MPLINPSGGTPGGSDTQVQYNNAGAFGGSSNLTFTSGTNTLGMNVAVGLADPLTITGLAGGANTTGGAVTVAAGAGGATNANGGLAKVQGGLGAGTGNGGTAQILAGQSGSGATGNGGAVTLTAGASNATDGTGGALNANGGAGSGTGAGGTVTIQAGGSGSGATGTGGEAFLFAGASNATAGQGGRTLIRGGLSKGTDQDGNNVIITACRGTGAGRVGYVQFETDQQNQASGTTLHSPIRKKIIGHSVSGLSSGVATSLCAVSLATLKMGAVRIFYNMEITDGTDMTAVAGEVLVAMVNKGGVLTSATTLFTEAVAKSDATDTITNVFTVSLAANLGTIKVTPTLTGMTPTTFSITMEIDNQSAQSVTAL